MQTVLYYSHHCPNSVTLTALMRDSGFDLARIKLHNISTQPGKPPWLTKVPLLVANNRVYIDDDLFALFAPPAATTPPLAEEPAGQQELDPHDPRARLSGATSAMGTDRQATSLPMRSSVSDASGNFMELDAYNHDAMGMLCGKDSLGPLQEKDDVMDFKAAPTLMNLPDCAPMPSNKADKALV
jgi:hypothetical protein